MMPLEHDHYCANVNPASICTGRIEGTSIPVEPVSGSTSNVAPYTDDQVLNQQLPTPRCFSVLSESLRPVMLKFEDVCYTIRLESGSKDLSKGERKVLNDASGIARPGELMAMLGPSGSGKTTLLTALAGRLPGKISGRISYNGQPFSTSMKRKTGLVTQDDILYPHLTVLETLTFAAQLKLPSQLTTEEKIEQAELVIVELGLTKCRNTIIGGPMIRGVSGGERKRVSIGQEMVVNPSLLFLDEPTSGLDSTTAQRLVVTLRGLARGGRTVVTTIHQPSSRLYRMFDKVVVLSDGCPVYSGSGGSVIEYFGSIGFMPGFDLVNPADFLLDLANGKISLTWVQQIVDYHFNIFLGAGVTPEKQDDQVEYQCKTDNLDNQKATKKYLVSSYKKNIYPALKDEIQRTCHNPVGSTGGDTQTRRNGYEWTTSWWVQFKVLLRRGLKERKHESYSGLRIFQVLTVALLAGLLWWQSDTKHIQDQVGLLFFFSIFWGYFPLFNAIFAFPQERPLLIKERSSGMYRLSSYYFARTAGDLPMELILPTIFITITYWMGGLKPSFATFTQTLLIILFNVLVSQGLGLALGAILMDVKQATTLSSVTMLVFLLASGYYIQHIPPFIAWLKCISFSHYCYKLLVGVQYSESEVYECGPGLHCRVLDFPGIKDLGIESKAWDVAAMAAMLVGYRVLAYLALRIGQPH